MKRLALLSVFSLMLASAVFAPAAMAQEVPPGEVDVQSMTLGPGGSLSATGTIQCFQDWQYSGYVEVRQKASGNVYNTTAFSFFGNCEGNVPTTFTASGLFSDRPFHRGPATVRWSSSLYEPVSGTSFQRSGLEAARIR